jgi:hypothetical protein
VSPRVKTLRRVRHRLAPARRISFGSLLESTDDMGMEVDGDDRSFDLSGGRMGSGLGLGFGSPLGLGFGAGDDGKEKEREKEKDRRSEAAAGGGSTSVFGAVLGEAFSVKPRAMPERTPRRDRTSKERGLKEGTLGSAFRMA